MLSNIQGNKISFTLTEDPENKPMVFTVPVIADGNHNNYTITVTVTPISGFLGDLGDSDVNPLAPFIPLPVTPITPADTTPNTPDEPDVKPLVVSTTAIKGLTSYKKAFKITWTAKKNVTGYQIQYSTNKNFKNAKKVVVTNAKAKSKKITKLKAKTKYYVRIRCYNKNENGKKEYSKWSAAKSAKTKLVL